MRLLAAQRHHVADRGQGGQVEVVLGGLRRQRLGQLERDPEPHKSGAPKSPSPGCTTVQPGSCGPGRW